MKNIFEIMKEFGLEVEEDKKKTLRKLCSKITRLLLIMMCRQKS